MALIIGREDNGTPIFSGSVTSSTSMRQDYRTARSYAKGLSTGYLREFLRGYNSMNLIQKVIKFLGGGFMSPDPDILAFRDELGNRNS